MLTESNSVPLKHLLVLFWALLLVGSILTIPLFHFDLRKFFKSALFTKIVFWIPIFAILLVVLYLSNVLRLIVLATLIVASLIELLAVMRNKKNKILYAVYSLVLTGSLLYFYRLGSVYKTEFVNLLITLCFASVLADVSAFFFGNYFGKHKLPEWLNNRKSWEGVLGEIVGAFIGILLVNSFVEPVLSLWLFLPIGVGSAIGDITNSFIKRRAGVKDWSNAIPGHGGFIDRLSSVAGSVVLTFYFIKLTAIA